PRFGSGRLVGANLVLTARHVLTDEYKVLEDGWGAAIWSESKGSATEDSFLPAKVVWCARQDESDVALLRLMPMDGGLRYPQLVPRWGKVSSGRAEEAWSVGFPRIAIDARSSSGR